MIRSRKLLGMILVGIGCTSVVYHVISQYTRFTEPYFIWFLAAIVLGILVRKGKRES